MFIIERNHATHIIGKFITDYKLSCKLGSNDQFLVIKEDVWVGIGVYIPNGVIIRQWAIITSGVIVTKNISPYALKRGVPVKLIKYRWSCDQIMKYEEIVNPPEEHLSKKIITHSILN